MPFIWFDIFVFKKMEPLPWDAAHPEAYIVGPALSLLTALGGLPGGGFGGPKSVHFSSASYGLNAVPTQFVLPLERAQKGPFSRFQ